MNRALSALAAATVVGGILAACASDEARTNDPIDDDEDRDASSFTQPDARPRSDASSGASSGGSSSSSSGGSSGGSSSSSSGGSSGSSGGSSSSSSGGSSGGAFVAPTCDGTLGAGEYGANNSQVSGDQQWAMTWDDTNLYLAVSNATVSEAAILYLDEGGGAAPAGGTSVGTVYDGQAPGTLPFAADLVAYMKGSYDEYGTADGAGGWTVTQTHPGMMTCVTAPDALVREMVVPWAILGGRPASFSFLVYLTSGQGYVYGELPSANPEGTIGTSGSVFTTFYSVADSAAVPLPFAVSN